MQAHGAPALAGRSSTGILGGMVHGEIADGGRVLAVVPVRDGQPSLGAGEAIAEAGGAAVLIGSGTEPAAAALPSLSAGWCAEVGDYAPARWAAALAEVLTDTAAVLLPASPDGRDLAPRLAAAMDRPLLAGCCAVAEGLVEVVRFEGRVVVAVAVDGPLVATLMVGMRSAEPAGVPPRLRALDLTLGQQPDVEVLEVLPPDLATADLADARRIFAAGGGLTHGEPAGAQAVDLLAGIATALGASYGATRVVTDAGHAQYQRQIGTTGVIVDPDLYVAFGISGASQHLGGLGRPDHVVSVNPDAECPMSAMADLVIVADAPPLLCELADRLGVRR